MKISDEMVEAVQKANHYALDDALIRRVLEPAFESASVTDDQIKHMANRFLQWKLPDNFNPDGGISFKRIRNENSPWPAKNEPVGTNLLDATQAEEMVRHIVEGVFVD